MLNDRDKANLDQASALIAEAFPPMWWRIYKGLIAEGFKEAEAMDLLKTYIRSTGVNKGE